MKSTFASAFNVTLCLVVVLSVCGLLQAAPYAGDILELEQPDGSVVQIRFWGDEYYARGESLDGYTVVRDPATGWIVYAQLNEDGSELIATEVVYDHRVPTDPNHPLLFEHPHVRTAGHDQAHRRSGLPRRLRQRQEVIEAIHLERRIQLHPERFMQAAEEGVYAAPAETAPAPVSGSVVGLTLLVEFPDQRATISASEIDRFCNEWGYTGYGNNGSVRDYFWEVSGGQLDYTNVVTDYVMLNNNKSYYDSCGGWGKAGELIDEALNKLCAQGFDFSGLTRRSNGRVMALNVFYAGSPACGWSEGLWPHMSTRNVTICGTSFGTYQITNIGSSLRLGTFCHENGHMVLGYPDLYDYTDATNGAGSFCLMSYSGPGENPVPPCGYLRSTSGWETVVDITHDPSGTLRTHPANTNLSYRYSNPNNSREYFLIESRLKTGRNSGLPAEGLLIWRINEDGSNTSPTPHPTHPYRQFFRVALEQADNQFHLERKSNYGDANDSFRGGYRDTFDDFTTPDAKWWDESFSGLSITQISSVSGQMSFLVGGGFKPTAHYRFERNGQDASDNGYHAVGYNFPGDGSFWNDASFEGSYSDLGGSLQLSGAGEYAELPSAVGAGGQIGIAFWMRADQKADMIPLDKFPADASGAGWSVRLRNDGHIAFLVGSAGHHTEVATRHPVYEAGRWVHVACSFKDGQARIFINGRLRALQSGLTQTPDTSVMPVRLGIPSQIHTEWVYQGLIDDVRFYDMELTEGRLEAVDGLNFKPGRGTILHLPLDERSGVVAEDRSRHRKDGSLKNGLSFDSNSESGVAGAALRFDGTDDYIEVPGGFYQFNGGLTVSMWVYPTEVKQWARFIDFGNGSSADNILLARYGTTNDLTFQVYNGSSGGGHVRAANAIELNTWQHFAATITDGGSVVLYKNGQVIASGISGSALNVYRTRNYIGRSNWDADAYYAGLMDDIRLYNDALSGSEVQSLYQHRRMDSPYPLHGADDVNPNIILEWTPPMNAVRYDVYVGTTASAVASAGPDAPAYQGRRLNPRYKPAALDAWRDYFWRVDAILTDGSVVTGPVWAFSTVGGVMRQVWTGISGTSVADLTGSDDYPDYPTLTDWSRDFEAPTDWADNYGTRMVGLLYAPVSGPHTFWIASDDSSELWLSPVPNPSQMAKYASVTGWTNPRQWDRYASQKTPPLNLVAGNFYYVMALQKEGGGGDHLAVAWEGPSNPVRSVIDGFWLTPTRDNEWPSFHSPALPSLSIDEGKTLNHSIAASASDPDDDALTYVKYGGPQWLSVAPNGQLSGTPRDGDTGVNTFLIGVQDGKGGSDAALLHIDIRDLYTGSRGPTDLLPFAACWLTDGQDNLADLTGSGRTDYTDWNAFALNWGQDIADGLAAHWTMDDATGLTVRDQAGRLEADMVNMSDFARVPGRFGNALFFDGDGGYLRVSGYSGLSGGSARTVSAWIKSPGTGSNMVIASWGQVQPGRQFLFGVFAEGTLAVYSGGPNIKTTQRLLDDRWHHVAAVVPDTASPSLADVRLYIDGVLQTDAAVSSNQLIDTVPDGDVLIGAVQTGPNQAGAFYKGLLDDVRLYDRALSEEEIETLGVSRLQLHLSFDETSGVLAVDGSLYGRDAILINHPIWYPAGGVKGGALSFDGIEHYVRVPDYAGVAGASARTVSAWIKSSGTGRNMAIASWGQTQPGRQFLFGVFAEGTLAVYSGGPYIKTTQRLLDDNWHHVAAVVPDTPSPGLADIRLYIDGVLQTETYLSSNSMIDTTPDGDVWIGAMQTGPNQADAFFKGLIDELRIYNKALETSDMVQLME